MKNMLKKASLCVAVTLAAGSIGCATMGVGGEKAPLVNSYECAGGKTIRTRLSPETNQLQLTLPDGVELRLTAIEGSGGNKFSNGTATMTRSGKVVSVEFTGDRAPLTGCTEKP